MKLEALAEGIRGGDRRSLSRAITLVESSRSEDLRSSQELLHLLDPGTAPAATRVGITGVPGVGKSTFIDSFGMHLCEQGLRVAVLAVDPSSALSGGSILGDKTRMERLSRAASAYIRPSPGGSALGGVARRTREAIQLCEAAGFDVVLVETIGVGQAEVAVAELVDTFVLLMLAGAGDELQGIKRGIMELCDLLVINKADGDNRERAQRAAAEYRSALELIPRRHPDWARAVQTCSALAGEGIAEVWAAIRAQREALGEAGLSALRSSQALRCFEETLRELALARALERQDQGALEAARAEVAAGRLAPTAAALRLLAD